MKTPKPYRVKSAYGMYRKGDIIFPTGMLRDELIMCGRIDAVPIPAATDPEPIDDISDDEEDVLIETATAPEPITAMQPRGNRGRHGR